MSGIPKEHDKLYFDKLIRTQKLESVLSLIHATYRAKKESNAFFSKELIAKRLVDGYKLFRTNPKGHDQGAGSYTGEESQFESQYTIGHEMCIWKNSELDLNEKAIEVAENKITIREYFDIFFLNYFQPVDNKAIHPLFQILKSMKDRSTNIVDKNDLPLILGVDSDNESINGLCNFLDGTNYINYSDNKYLKLNKLYKVEDLLDNCNTRYIGDEGLRLAKIELGTDERYAEYIMSEKTNSVFEEIEDLSIEQLGDKLKDMYNSPNIDNSVAIHLFGIKYGKLIREKKYVAKDIVNLSGISSNYSTEVNKGIKLSHFVQYRNVETDIVLINAVRAKEVFDRHPRHNKVNHLNTILFGAPGTGKTYSTIEYALSIIDNQKQAFKVYSTDERKKIVERFDDFIDKGQIAFTTFHQSYSYEDFIQGLRPDGEGSFRYIDGIFKNISQKALVDPSNEYVLIIDEINRGNISKIFGELITLIEEDKRYGEINGLSVILPSGDKFVIPNNLYIIGTMNSADKSISLIDSALRRRFIFIEKPVDINMIEDQYLRDVLFNLNDFLKKELRSTDLLIGHSYFMNKHQNDIIEIFNYNIIPLLYEYFYDDENKIRKALESMNLEISITENGSFGRIKLNNGK